MRVIGTALALALMAAAHPALASEAENLSQFRGNYVQSCVPNAGWAKQYGIHPMQVCACEASKLMAGRNSAQLTALKPADVNIQQIAAECVATLRK